MNSITLRQTFTAAGTSEAFGVTGPALIAQVNGADCVLQGTNFPDQSTSWQALGTISGYAPLTVTTSFAYLRVVASGACDVRVSAGLAPAPSVGAGGATDDRELVVTTYRVKAAFTGASVGDTVTCTRVLDVDGATASIVQTLWYNESTAAALASAPSAANLESMGAPGLTDAQLRASAVPVSVAGVATAANQATEISSLASIDTKLGTLLGQTDGIEGPLGAAADAAASTDTGTFSVISLIKRGLQNWTAVLSRLPASLGAKASAASLSVTPASDAQYTLAQTGVQTRADVTRPANITAYTAGDVVGGVLTFAGVAPLAASSFAFMGVDLRYDVAAVPSGMSTMRLHLYSATPASAYADNAAWDLPAGDRSAYLGYVDIGTPSDLGSTLFVANDAVGPKQLKLAAGSTSLFGYLQTVGGYTPAANSETLSVILRGLAGV